MAERIKKTPIKEALAAMDIVWGDAQQRLDDMGPERALARVPGALHFNSTHPFRDKLHIEGMMEGLKFALTGRSEAVEYWLRRAESVGKGEAQPDPQPPLTEPRMPWPQYVVRLVNRLFPMPRSNQ